MPPRKRGASQPPRSGNEKAPHRTARPTTDVKTPARGRRRSASARCGFRDECRRYRGSRTLATGAVWASSASPVVEQPAINLLPYSYVPDASAVDMAPDSDADSDDNGDPEQLLSGLLGGELPTQLPGYSTINRPLGGHISAHLRRNIHAGKYVNQSHLLLDYGLTDQQQQQVTLQVIPGQRESHLSVAKPTTTKAITNISQWSPAFCIYAAVLTGRFPQRAPGLFKYMSDVCDFSV